MHESDSSRRRLLSLDRFLPRLPFSPVRSPKGELPLSLSERVDLATLADREGRRLSNGEMAAIFAIDESGVEKWRAWVESQKSFVLALLRMTSVQGLSLELEPRHADSAQAFARCVDRELAATERPRLTPLVQGFRVLDREGLDDADRHERRTQDGDIPEVTRLIRERWRVAGPRPGAHVDASGSLLEPLERSQPQIDRGSQESNALETRPFE